MRMTMTQVAAPDHALEATVREVVGRTRTAEEAKQELKRGLLPFSLQVKERRQGVVDVVVKLTRHSSHHSFTCVLAQV